MDPPKCILRQNSTVNLGSVNLRQNYAKPRRTATFNATMSASTVTIGGIPRTVITVTLRSIASGGNGLRTVSTPVTMVWNPSAGGHQPHRQPKLHRPGQ